MKFILLCLGLLIHFSSAAAPQEHWQEYEAKRFFEYVLEKNEGKLIEFAKPSERYFDGARLKPDIFAFLYQPKGQWSSVPGIAKLGKILIKLVKQYLVFLTNAL